MPTWNGRWSGGRKYVDGRTGRQAFLIERMHAGRRYTIRLSVTSEHDALAELALFDREPKVYQAKLDAERTPEPEAVTLDETSIQAVLDGLRAKGENEVHIASVKRYCVAWANALRGRELRTLKLADLERLLARWPTARHPRIAALKTFCRHHVNKGLLAPHENPAALLKIEKRRPEKLSRAKGYPIATVERHFAAVNSPSVRDVLVLRCLTGMHHSEVERIGRGECELRAVKGGKSGIAGVVRFIHKSKYEHLQSLNAQAFAAAKRLHARGHAPTKDVVLAQMRRTAERLSKRLGKDVDYLRPGELRHSFITWATSVGKKVTLTGAGVDITEVSRLVGHRSPNMTSDRYDSSVPPMIVLPIRLEHPDDSASSKLGTVHRLPVAG